MKTSISLPDPLYEAVRTVYESDTFSEIVQNALISMLEKDGYKVKHIPETWEIERG